MRRLRVDDQSCCPKCHRRKFSISTNTVNQVAKRIVSNNYIPGGFITAVPSDEDGKDTLLRPRNFQIAVAYRLGIHVLENEISCPLCTQPINKFGDHATCCAKSENIIIRHNSLRNLIDSIGTDAKLSPVLEKESILGSTTGRRPGDVSFPEWAEGKGLAIDVAVTSPLAPSSLRLTEPCEWYAATKKQAKCDLSFESTNFIFSAMVFETLGAINVEGEEVLRQLFRLLLSVLGESSLLVVAELGLAFLATCNVLSRKLFSRVSMAVSSVMMLSSF